MAGRNAALLFTVSVRLVFAALGQQNLSVGSGGRVTLRCPAADVSALEAVIWSRTDLDSDVLSVRPGKEHSLDRHPSYQNRVSLLDWQMKNGDASLVLDKVKTDDSGTYECRVKIKGEMRHINTVNLQVEAPPGTQDGSRNDGSVGPFPAARLVLILLFALCWVTSDFSLQLNL